MIKLSSFPVRCGLIAGAFSLLVSATLIVAAVTFLGDFKTFQALLVPGFPVFIAILAVGMAGGSTAKISLVASLAAVVWALVWFGVGCLWGWGYRKLKPNGRVLLSILTALVIAGLFLASFGFLL
jgi:membrane protein DedA with SNARE-associated domain